MGGPTGNTAQEAGLVQKIQELRAEHQGLERQLEELNRHVYLTPAEQVETQRIKKLKLQKKDRIRELEEDLSPPPRA